jgi:sec-independent protein translocase protein TatB
VFGFSFSELLMICVVALIAVGPKKLPGMLHSLGQFLRKMRNMTNDVRNQTGIDQLLRSEGLHGGLNELRGLLRGNHGISFDPPHVPTPTSEPFSGHPVSSEPIIHPPVDDPYAHMDIDSTREYPLEGADAYGALPDDLIDNEPSVAVNPAEAAASGAKTEATTEAKTEAKTEATTEVKTEATTEATTPSA